MLSQEHTFELLKIAEDIIEPKLFSCVVLSDVTFQGANTFSSPFLCLFFSFFLFFSVWFSLSFSLPFSVSRVHTLYVVYFII